MVFVEASEMVGRAKVVKQLKVNVSLCASDSHIDSLYTETRC